MRAARHAFHAPSAPLGTRYEDEGEEGVGGEDVSEDSEMGKGRCTGYDIERGEGKSACLRVLIGGSNAMSSTLALHSEEVDGAVLG